MILRADQVRAGDAIVWADGTVRVVTRVHDGLVFQLNRTLGVPSHAHDPDEPIICVARNYPLGGQP